jgi:hypothetical protein
VAASGYTRAGIHSTAYLAVDNLDFESVLSDEGIAEDDLHAGRGRPTTRSLVQGILNWNHRWLGYVSVRQRAIRRSRMAATAPGPGCQCQG